MNEIERFGPDVESAIELALEDLGIKREDAKIEVLEEPKKGILGLGGNPARVKVSKITMKDLRKGNKEKETRGQGKTGERENQNKKDGEKKEGEKVAQSNNNKNNYKKSSFNKKIDVPAELELKEANEITSGEVLDLAKEIFSKTGLTVSLKLFFNEEKKSYFLEVFGEDANFLIGKKGANIPHIQYLFNLMLIKKEIKERLFLDVENYKKRHVSKNVYYAIKKAEQVKKTNKSVKLSPMTKQERKNIHEVLQSIDGIETVSEGKEPNRSLVIKPIVKK